MSRSLPDVPSLEFERKPAKALARDSAAAMKAIDANDTARLGSLIAEQPALLIWGERADEGPALSQIWQVPGDLPHAAGLGDLEAVAKRFANGHPQFDDPSVYASQPGESPLTTVQEVVECLCLGGAKRQLRDSGLSPGSRCR